jgi:hypothetical protein
MDSPATSVETYGGFFLPCLDLSPAEASAGGIAISRTVHEAVAGRLKATFDDLVNPPLRFLGRLPPESQALKIDR